MVWRWVCDASAITLSSAMPPWPIWRNSPIDIDGETDHQAWGATLRPAIRHELTLYDAAYLELALRRKLPLATLDEDLRGAARAEKVKLVV